MLRIRTATIADASMIADLSRSTFLDTFGPHNRPENMQEFLDKQFTREVLIPQVGQPGNHFIIAELDERVAGYARLRENNNPPQLEKRPTIEVARIYAVREAQGRGVGQAMMQYAIDLATRLGKEAVWLGVWEKNTKAIAFYEQWGFRRFADHLFMLGTDPQTDWLMKLELNGKS